MASLRPNAQQHNRGQSPPRPDRLWGPSPTRAPKPPMPISSKGALRTVAPLIGPRPGSVGCSPVGGGARKGGHGGEVPCWQISGSPGKPLPRGPQNACLSPLPFSSIPGRGFPVRQGHHIGFPFHSSRFPRSANAHRRDRPPPRLRESLFQTKSLHVPEGRFSETVRMSKTPPAARCGNLPENGVGFGGAGAMGSRAGWQLVWGGASRIRPKAGTG